MGSLCGSLFGQSQSTTFQPPAAVTSAVTNILDQAATQSQQPYPQYTPDTSAQYMNYVPGLVAPMTPNQYGAGQSISDLQGYTDPYFGAATGLSAAAATPIQLQQYNQQNMNQYMNPFLNDVVGSAVANINQTNAQQQQQALGSEIGQGAYGGDRAGIAQAELARQQNLANNATISNLLNTGFNQAQGEFNTQQQAQANAQLQSQQLMNQSGINLANYGTQGQQAALQQAQAQYGYGSAEQQQQQANLSTAYQQYLNQQMYPYQQLSWYSQLASGAAPAMGGTTTGYSPTVSPAAGVLGGLSTIGALSNPSTQSSNALSYASSGLGALGSIGSGIFSAFGLKDGGRVGYAEGGVPVSPVTQAYNDYVSLAESGTATKSQINAAYQNYLRSLQGATPPWKGGATTTTPTTPTTPAPITTPTTGAVDNTTKVGGGGGGGGANGPITARNADYSPDFTSSNGPVGGGGYGPYDSGGGPGNAFNSANGKGILSGIVGGVNPTTGAQTGIAGAVNALLKGNSPGTMNAVLNSSNRVAVDSNGNPVLRADGTPYPNTTSGLTAQEYADKFANGNLSNVSARISTINGAPQIDYFVASATPGILSAGSVPATQLSPAIPPVQTSTDTSADTSSIRDPLANGADLSAAKAAPITNVDSGGYSGIPANTTSLSALQRQQEVENSLPTGLIAATSQLESSNNPNAVNGNSIGLYGFMPTTAANLGLMDRTDPASATTAAGAGYSGIVNSLQNAGIQNPSAGQAYLGWQQGATGAAALLNAPAGTSAVQALINAGVDPDSAQKSITGNLPKGADADISAADFAKLWTDKANAIANAQTQVQTPSLNMAAPLPPTQGDTNYTATPIPVQTDLSYLPIQQPDTNASATGLGDIFDGNQTAPSVPNPPAVETPNISDQNSALAVTRGLGAIVSDNQPSQPASSGVLPSASQQDYSINTPPGVVNVADPTTVGNGQGNIQGINPSPASAPEPTSSGVLPSATGQGGMFDNNPAPNVAPVSQDDTVKDDTVKDDTTKEDTAKEDGGGGGDKRGGRIGPHHNHYAQGGVTPISMEYGLPSENDIAQMAADFAGSGAGTLSMQGEALGAKGILPATKSKKGGRIHARYGQGITAPDDDHIAGDASFYDSDDDETDTSYLPIEKPVPFSQRGFAIPQVSPSGLPPSYKEQYPEQFPTPEQEQANLDRAYNVGKTIMGRMGESPDDVAARVKSEMATPIRAAGTYTAPYDRSLSQPDEGGGDNVVQTAAKIASEKTNPAPAETTTTEPKTTGVDISKLDLTPAEAAPVPTRQTQNQQVAQDMTRVQSDAPQPGFGYVAPPPADMRNFFGFNYGMGLLSGQSIAAAGDAFAKNVMAQQEQQRATMTSQAQAAQAYGAAQSYQAQARYTDTQRSKASVEGTIAGTKLYGLDANGNPTYTLMRPLRAGETMTANGQIIGGDGSATDTGVQLQHIKSMPMSANESADQKEMDLNKYSSTNMAGADPATVAAYNGEYRKQFDDAQQRASAAGYDKKNINETAVVLGDMAKEGLFSAGKGAGAVYNTASLIQSVAQRAGIDLGLSKDTPLPEILEKIRTLKAESYTGAQRTAAVWLTRLADANPSVELRPETSNAILTQYMLDNQRSIDFANHMEDVGAINPTAINGTNSFNKMYGNTYRQEQQAINTLLNSTMPNGSNPIAAAIKGDLKQKDFDIIVKAMQKQGLLPPVTNLDRYIFEQ
jgi:hypothetical protein